MKKSNLIVFVFILFLGGILSTSLWLYEKKTNHKNQVIISKEKKNKKVSLFDNTIVHEVHIHFDQPKYWDSLVYHKTQENLFEKKTYLKADVVIDGKNSYNVGVKIKGESSYKHYPSKKKSLKINFDKFIKEQDYQGFEEINLNNNFKDPTFMREKLYLDFLQEVGVPSQKNAYAKVYINNQYWGLYLMVEDIDKKFLKRHFGTKKGTLVKGEPKAYLDWHGKDWSGYVKKYKIKNGDKKKSIEQLIPLIDIINNFEGSDEMFEVALESTFNIKSCLKVWAVNNVLVNIDAYNLYYPHNFYLYYNPKTAKFEWINFDGNYSFGAWSPVFTLEQMEALDIYYVKKDAKRHPLVSKLLKENIKTKQTYKSIIKNEVLDHLIPDKFNKKIETLKLLINESVYADSLKMYTNREFDINIEQAIGDIKDPGAFIPGLKPFIKKRRENVEAQLKGGY
ncbi:CotH kinase family protein [Flavobacteriaceae bacterium]|nr:CotH kinase family protein [Flavobacteriaceae bacterium]